MTNPKLPTQEVLANPSGAFPLPPAAAARGLHFGVDAQSLGVR